MKYCKLYILGLLLMLFVSCDDYLDIIPKGEIILTNVEDYADIINSESLTALPTAFYGFSNIVSDDSWTHPQAILNNPDEPSWLKINFLYRGDDPVKWNRLNTTISATAYTDMYSDIARFNIILAYIDDAKGNDAELRRRTKAEAQMLVAWKHFLTVNIFAKQYNPATAASDLAIPIRDNFDMTAEMHQSTVAEVYKFIENLLDEAIPNLSNNPQNPYHPSKAAGYAFKAKIHLQKREYTLAKEAALKSYELNNELFDLVAYYKNPTKPVINVIQKENLLWNMTVNTDRPFISPALRQLFEADTYGDARWLTYFELETPTTSADGKATDDKEFTARLKYTASEFAINKVGLRTSEVMLILAECYAREGGQDNYNKAMKLIDDLRKKRIVDYENKPKPEANTEEDAMQIVLEERRKELLFGLNRVFDIRRLSNDPKYMIIPTRLYPASPNSMYGAQKTYSIDPDSYLFTFPIPPEVLNADAYMQNTTPEKLNER